MRKDSSSQSQSLAVLSREPLVAGAPMSALDNHSVPTDLFFIRNHFPAPAIDADRWTLKVTGQVRDEFSLIYSEVKEMRRTRLEALLECAGNSRAAIQPPIEGLLWDHSGVGSARWAGVALRRLIARARPLPSAQEVLLIGADRGTEAGESGEMCFAMSLPMDKALHPDTLLAYEMNGVPLLPEHGYPLRAVVPGWYGMTSVKWLVEIQVLDRPFQGFHQSDYYVYRNLGTDNGSPGERVTSIKVKSLISWPGRGQMLELGTHRLRGVAWSGAAPVAKVEISTDDGCTWRSATLQESGSRHAWRQWEYLWEAAEPGRYLIRARATDELDNAQPVTAPWNFRGFASNSIHAVPVVVKRPHCAPDQEGMATGAPRT